MLVKEEEEEEEAEEEEEEEEVEEEEAEKEAEEERKDVCNYLKCDWRRREEGETSIRKLEKNEEDFRGRPSVES